MQILNVIEKFLIVITAIIVMETDRKTELNENRFYGLDLLKAILLISVILGHIYSYTLGYNFGNPIRYAIYSFHMPLFLSLSGFLLNLDFLKNSPIKSIVKKYFFRLVLPTIISWFLWYFYRDKYYFKLFNPADFYRLFFLPHVFIWYSYTLLFYIAITTLFIKLSDKINVLFVFSLILAFLAVYYIKILPDKTILDTYLNRIFYTYRPHFYTFFLFGIIIKRNFDFFQKLYIQIGSLSIVIISSIIRYFEFNNLPSTSNYYTVNLYVLNFSLIIFALCNFKKLKIRKLKVIDAISRNSLPIYLYHIFLIRHWDLWPSEKDQWYFLVYILQILLIIVIRILQKIKFIDNFIFGNYKPKSLRKKTNNIKQNVS